MSLSRDKTRQEADMTVCAIALFNFEHSSEYLADGMIEKYA
jgi:hypothetical protein